MVVAAGAISPAPRANEIRAVTVLGSTGSIGCNTLDLIGRSDTLRVAALTAHRNVELLARQAREFGAELAVICDPDGYDDLVDALAGTSTRVGAGRAAVVEAAQMPVDIVVAAIVGAAGIEATYAALEHTPTIAIANKECLVAAGALFKSKAKRLGVTLLPVDSEHSAIFQVLDQTRPQAVERIILTASGGPFRTWSIERMEKATPEDALQHPNWSMGAKISIDSATMMNKGLELIEAYHLFEIEPERLEVLVHPQSIIHSLVAYHDGSVLAQLGQPDMRTPISVALAWPERMPAPVAPLDLAAVGTLTFEAADADRFPALRLAYDALAEGGGMAVVLSAANEVAVQAFLDRRIGFLDIARTVEATLESAGSHLGPHQTGEIETVLELDLAARHLAHELLPTT